MNISKVLFATDFSPHSDAALALAESLAVAEEATLLIVHVDNDTPGLVFGDVGYGYIPQVDEIACAAHQELLAVKPGNEAVRYEHHFLRGSADDAILQLAERERVDLIVIGTHGRTGLTRLLMGSVAEAIVRRAACPVITIRLPSNGSDGKTAGQRSAIQS